MSLLNLTSCALGATPQGVAPIESVIRLGEAETTQPSPSPTDSTEPSNSPSPTASSSEDGSESEDADPTPAGAVFDKEAELSIEDQVGNGRTIVIDEFEVAIDNLWLVICTKDDRVLTALLTTTESKPVTVTLTNPISKSQELYAYLYMDDGDGRFDAQRDSAVYEEPGELIDEDFEYEIG